MRLTNFKETIVDESDLVGALYSGKNINFEDIRLDSFEDCKKFNDAVKKNYDNIPQIKVHEDSTLTQAEFDAQNQSNWFMPSTYKTFDIENYILCQAPDIAGYTRVEEELELFRQHNMVPLLKYLKYLVDTMRANNVVWGVGRGSSVASYVLYLLGVHKIDSIKYKLDIKEFLK